MAKKVVIIGGGIVGLSTAYFLHKEGHQVTVVDKSNFTTGASYVNAGYITPSHIISLAAPGMITKGIKWMFNPASPFYMKPRLDWDFIKWGWAFKKSATQKKVEVAIPVIKDINLLSQDLYVAMKSSGDFKFHYDHKGLLMAYKTDKMGETEWNIGKRAMDEGLKVQLLSKKQVDNLEPNANLDIKGAVYFHCDAHMTPADFMRDMLIFLKQRGVEILAEEEVKDIQNQDGEIKKVVTDKRELLADEYVLAAGSWTSKLVKQLGLKMHLQGGKGYRINVHRDTGITIPTILCEAKCAVTPMDGFTRIAGTMEFSGINHNISKVRVEAIANAAQSFYKDLKINQNEKDEAQCGLRPVSPDGLPYIGRSSKCKNAVFATGHAMMGWSLGPATGKLVSEIISERNTSMNIDSFHPDRRF
jgi:D-amino-acid dehydrogenase